MKATTFFQRVKNLCLSCLLVFFFTHTLSAKQIPTVTGILQTSTTLGTTVTIGTASATNTVQVGALSNAIDYKVRNTISLKYDLSSDTFFLAACKVKVKLNVKRWDKLGNPMLTRVEYLDVQINNFAGVATLEQAHLKLTDGYKVVVTVDSIWVNTVPKNILPRYVSVESAIDMDRYFDFTNPSTTTAPLTAITAVDLECDGVNDEVVVNWTPNLLAEEYQLEWTYTNNYSASGGTLPASAFTADFLHNSTRITTYNNSFRVSLLFNKGYLAFRVRAVGRDNTNPSLYIFGPWTSADVVNMGSLGGAQLYTIVTDHEPGKNWQYSASYAEEGKKKEVISYFDGSLHNRQAVTKVNSDRNVIVGETIYDYQGRPAVNVLGAPVVMTTTCVTRSEPSIHYYKKFNVDDTSKAYSANDFDVDITGTCNSAPGPMDTVSGASRYYSGNNPDKTAEQAYLPDAKKYPFTQVEYTPDQTGKIRNQSGVGITHQLGSGHETKYLYGQPNQIQVDRLFGSEVGDASHYKKNVVIDANGQSSVTYLNQEGKTIATSLAGVPPTVGSTTVTALDSLDDAGANQKKFTVDLFNKDANGHSILNNVPPSGDRIVFSTQLLVTYRSQYDFNYNFSIDTLDDPCLRDNVCLNCVYDLDIEIKDECGQVLGANQAVVGKVDTTGGVLNFNIHCTGSPIINDTSKFTLVLNPGVYTVSKVLTINAAARDFYVQNYLDSANNSCFKTLNDFIADALANIDTSDCYNTCASCAAALGSRDDYVSQGKGTAVQYDLLLEACLEPCKQKTLCETTFEMLLSDVSPGGQYGKYNVTTYDASTEQLSVLNVSNSLNSNLIAGQDADWKHPRIRSAGVIYPQYLDENGDRKRVDVFPNGANFLPQVDNVSLVYTDAATSQQYTYPENLTYLQDFLQAWEPMFARSLVMYHPEFAYYVSCSEQALVFPADTMSSDELDSLLLSTETFAEAVSKGFVVPGYATPAPAMSKVVHIWQSSGSLYDPFFLNPAYQYSTSANPVTGSKTSINMTGPASYQLNLQTLMNNRVVAYQTINSSTYSMPEVAAMLARCGNMYSSAPSATCTAFGTDYYPSPTPQEAIWNDSIRDVEWRFFRQFYYSEKQKLQFQRMEFYAKHSSDPMSGYFGGSNCCFGTTSYNPFASGMIVLSPFIAPMPFSAFYDPAQPCGVGSWARYAGVTKRFYDPANTGLNTSSVTQQIYQTSGQCPLAFELQNFLGAMASTSKLTSAGTTSMSTVSQFSPDLYTALNGGSMPSVYINYEWKLDSYDSDDLTAFLVDPVTGTKKCTFKLHISGSGIPSFDSIVGFQQLMPDVSAGDPGAFTVVAVYTNGGSQQTATISGSSCYDITNCSSPVACSPNQFASDMQNLFNAMLSSGVIGGTVPHNLSTDAACSPFLTTTIKNVLGTPNSAIMYDAPGTNIVQLYDNTNPSTYIQFTSLASSPSTYVGTPAAYSNINSAFNNLYTVNLIDASANVLTTITAKAQRFSSGDSTGISMGDCGLAEPAECSLKEHHVRRDLEKLVNELLSTKPFTGSPDIITMVDYSSLLQSYVFPGLTSAVGTYTGSTGTNPNFDSLSFSSLKHCESFALYHRRNDGTQLNFADIVQVSSLQGIGTPDLSGNYFDFKALATYSTTSGVYQDTIYGTSCWPLKNCEPCPQVGPDGTNTLTKMIIKAPLMASVSRSAALQSVGTITVIAGPIGTATVIPRCDTASAYKQWLDIITKYNQSAYANSNNAFLDTAVDWAAIRKYCNCLKEYATYLNVYNSSPKNAAIPSPKPLSQFDGCQDGSDCMAKYQEYLSKIASYNSFAGSKGGIPITTIVTAYQFVTQYCNCADSFFASLDSIMNGQVPMPALPKVPDTRRIDLASNCPPCDVSAVTKALLGAIGAYNESIFATEHKHQLSTKIDQATAERLCNCYKTYVNYLSIYTHAPSKTDMPLPMEAADFDGCSDGSKCMELYKRYINVVNNYNIYALSQKLPTVGMVYTASEFTAKYCNCAPEFIANLFAVATGAQAFSDFDTKTLLNLPANCKQPCTNGPQDSAFYFPPITHYVNPCVQQMINLAIYNAQNAYQQYYDSMLTDIAERYTQHCLGALENFSCQYIDKEYHFTLYYYDQAGNLVKTIPPEGVEPLNIVAYTDPLAQQILADLNTNQQHVFTEHRMATTYVYNSLNQLVYQSLPDHDNMDLCDGTNPNGLDVNLVINSVQFVSASKGYLCGYVRISSTQKRGLMYTTNDGGNNWTRVYKVSAGDLQKVQFGGGGTNGYAISSHGLLMKTADSGNSWDIVTSLYHPASGTRYVSTLTAMYMGGTNGVVAGIKSGSNSFIYYTNNGGVTFNAASVPAAASGDTVTSITYNPTLTLLIASVRNGTVGKLFSSSDGGVNWTQVSSFTANNLRKVQYSGSFAMAVGEDGTLLKSTAPTTGWQLVPTGTSHLFRDVHFKNLNEGIALIDSFPGKSQIWKTFDGGLTWALLSAPGKYYSALQCYQWPNEDKILAVGENGLVSRVIISTAPFGIITVNAPATTNLSFADGVNSTATGKLLSIAVSNTSPNAYMTYDANASTVTWTTFNTSTLAAPVASADAKFEKILITVANPATPDVQAILLTSTGKVYSFYRAYNAATASCALVAMSGGQSGKFFKDITLNAQSSGTSFYAFDTVAKQLCKITFSGTTANGTLLSNSPAITKNVQAIRLHKTGNELILVGNSGHISQTSNASTSTVTWTDASKKVSPAALNRVRAITATQWLAMGIDGSVWRSTGSATDWTLRNSGTAVNLIAFATSGTGPGWAAGPAGKLFQVGSSNTPNPTLTSITSPVIANFTDVALDTVSKNAYITASSGHVVYVPDYGALSPAPVLAASPVGTPLNGVWFRATSNAFVVGNNATVLSYAGTMAFTVKTLYTKDLINAHFYDANNGYVIDSLDVIRHTTDGGATWSVVIPDPASTGLTALHTTALNRAALVGLNKYIAPVNNTTLGSLTMPGTVPAGTNFYDIDFTENSNGITVGASGRCVRVVPSGSTYVLTDLGAAPMSGLNLRTVHVFQNGHFITAGQSGKIYYYNGTSYTAQTAFTPPLGLAASNITFNDVYFHDDRTGYLVGNNSAAYKAVLNANISTLGGTANSLAWTPFCASAINLGYTSDPQLANLTFNVIAFASRTRGMLAGSDGNISSSFPPSRYARLLGEQSGYYSNRFWYDKLGRLTVSQNTKQFNKVNPDDPTVKQAFSYTLYDNLGRVTEIGEKYENHVTSGDPSPTKFNDIFGSLVNGLYNNNAIDETKWNNWIAGAGDRREVTHTYYDNQLVLPTGVAVQSNLRKRIATVTYENVYDGLDNTYAHGTHYTYDIHGNVTSLWQENTQVGLSTESIKRVDYEFDLISGKVNKVIYEPGKVDQFIHRYNYDADNRITQVETSRDDIVYETDAKYFFYAHGPLARTEYGKDHVQGMDYAYVLNGFIKGVNSTLLKTSNDMGHDGDPAPGNLNANFARDAVGYSLNYYNGDYEAIDHVRWNTASSRFEAYSMSSDFFDNRNDLFNGNITGMVTTISKTGTLAGGVPSTPTPLPMANAYRYDQLNQLKRSTAYTNIDAAANAWKNDHSSIAKLYRNTFTYDANGNIKTQMKYDSLGHVMDSLVYHYETISGELRRNRLYHVNDLVSTPTIPGDLEDQGTFDPSLTGINRHNNYRFDEIGNLIRDSIEQIDTIRWNVYGKITAVIRKASSPKDNLYFDYDANGNRVAKHVYTASGTWKKSTYYLRDAEGNVLAVYDKKGSDATMSFKLKELHLYGSSRLGMAQPNLEMIGALPNLDTSNTYLGQKNYELVNQLGNVLSVITDKKLSIANTTTPTLIEYYVADIVSATDYYPFGSVTPGRNFTSVAYRYGFNGKEFDSETTTQDYGMRIYDGRLARFQSVDPMYRQYSELSTYQFASNTPIQAVDRDGEERWLVGALIGGGVEFVKQLVKIGKENVNGTGEDGLKHKFFYHALRRVDYADVGVKAAKGALNALVPGAGVLIDVGSEYLTNGIDYVPGNAKGSRFKYVGGKGGHEIKTEKFVKAVILANADAIFGSIFEALELEDKISGVVQELLVNTSISDPVKEQIGSGVGKLFEALGSKGIEKVLDKVVPPKEEEAEKEAPKTESTEKVLEIDPKSRVVPLIPERGARSGLLVIPGDDKGKATVLKDSKEPEHK